MATHSSNDSSGSSNTARSRYLSIISPVAYSASSCGYCPPPSSGRRSAAKTSQHYGIWAHRISPHYYQRLIDAGWRRSGDYIYKPDLDRTCCPQIPIRLDAATFAPAKRHKRALTNLLFHVRGNSTKPARWKGRWSRGRDWHLQRRWDLVEWSPHPVTTVDKGKQRQHSDDHNDNHDNTSQDAAWANTVAGPKTKRLETTLRLSSSTDEKYRLFRRYQSRVHGEPDDKISSRKGWERFLVDTSLIPVWPASGKMLDDRQEARWRAGELADPYDPDQPIPYGCYHQEYRLDGQLIAVGVLDVLPACISSVYLFYDPDFDHLELGKISALREIGLTRQLSRKPGMESIRHYYLGFYIHNCQKMRYKAEYRPCELLDCAADEWRAFSDIRPALDAGVHHSFEKWQARSGAPAVPSHTAADAAQRSSNDSSSVEGDEQAGKENGDDDDGDGEEEEERRIPTEPAPPPGMLDPTEMLDGLRTLASSRGGNPASAAASSGSLEVLGRALTLNASRQFEGIQPLLMSTFARAYLETGQSKEMVQAVECLAALGGDEDLCGSCVLFL
ncbi:uncharacterized protein PFL1_04682 [Pseudozyma flocculosa PF-1]|uniref:arginyltransferase n=2 Tax=Pseudozyma flocculosa TaxID=84751 RepID=A0A5C3FB87_9BASI|nr:uncharacterized protein PFL1_04682 [Pseudozyma flocculosa PF-1]EPQ27938.1 hypothetical protein PFL1_04682 [Pseudozyma flocculosa PF-1]SPO41724.1 related to arginine-tRNA-protein transferase [Pseudozyma flocculosa]